MNALPAKNRGVKFLLLFALVFGMALEAQAQQGVFKDTRQKRDRAGDGYMVAGELWEVIKPMNSNERVPTGGNGIEDPLRNTDGALHWITLGPDGGNWLEPSGLWPGGYDLTGTWRDGRRITFPVFESSGWTNPLRPGPDSDNRYMFAYYTDKVPGAGNAARDYKREERFTDNGRSHMVYEAGWPTTAGIDFKLRAHQYTSNDQNMNDFIAVEISMTNTGVVDANGDGTPEMTDHAIDALAVSAWTEPTISVRITQNSGRSNRFGAGRTWAYLGVPETLGADATPMAVWFANVPEAAYAGRTNPVPGERFMGVNDGSRLEGYTDVWFGQYFMGAKQGAISDTNLGAAAGNAPDKTTLFGTHGVGTGNQKGWYTSQPAYIGGVYSFNNSEQAFLSSTATWYQDYGKTQNYDTKNLAPNSAFFSGGTAGDLTTFVVGNASARPNGDAKYLSEDVGKVAGLEAPVFEDALNPTAASGDFYTGVKGNTATHTFANNTNHGVGPFALAVGESMTLTFVIVQGYRWEGINHAAKAAEWAWKNDWNVSASLPTPPAPDIVVTSTAGGSAAISWTDVSSIDSGVSGYKIWRSSQFKRSKWLDSGFRGVDNYHRVHEVGGALQLDDVNPYFDGEAKFVGDTQGWYQPNEWGPFELVAKIPTGQLSSYPSTVSQYDYTYEDTEAITGFTYWYYVSSYKEGGSYAGPRGPISGHIESSNFNRNGRNDPNAALGEIGSGSPWGGTYPFATRASNYPAAGTIAAKNMGTPFTVTPPVSNIADVEANITVTPNPYKITGLNDVRNNASSHSVDFLGLPADYTITILDVSGQIIFETDVAGAVDGKYTWDMFSKDGIEVASGVYIYHVQYGDGLSVTGHLAILR